MASGTIWDGIYQKYLADGEAWASLKEDIHPYFFSFMEKNIFSTKNALDIGCGNGKYLMDGHETLTDGTCIPVLGPEKGLPHSFFSVNEIDHLFSRYANLQVVLDTDGSQRWIITGEKR